MNQPLAFVHPGAKIIKNVVIKAFTTINNDVVIEEGTWIGSNVTIMEGRALEKIVPFFPEPLFQPHKTLSTMARKPTPSLAITQPFVNV